MNLLYNKTYAAKQYTGGDYIYGTKDGVQFGGVGVDREAVITTGYYTNSQSGARMLQILPINGHSWIDLSEGWQLVGNANIYSQAQAQSLVDRIIENNKLIVSCNLLCARFAYRLTGEEKQLLYDLQSRLQERNDRLVQDGYCQQMQTSTPAGYSKLESYMQSFMAGGGVGLVISTSTIIVSAVVVASLATAAYFAYKYLYDQSNQDVRYSKQLTRTLQERLTAQEYQQLLDETQGIVTKAKIRTMVAGTGNLFKYALIGTGLYWLFTQLKGSKIVRKKKGGEA